MFFFRFLLQSLPLYVLFLSLTACAQQQHAASVVYKESAADYTSVQQDILKYINEYRHSKGLSRLQMNDVASSEAVIHSRDMAKGIVDFGHDGFDTRMQHLKEKLGFLRGTAENVAYGKINAKEVVNMWLDSPGHKKNIEGNYNLMGIGIARSTEGYLYFTQIFLLK